jgi:putative membrane protein
MRRVLILIGINALALWVASELVSGITLAMGLWKILLVAAIFGLINAFVRPVAKLLSLPVIVLTLGLFILLINAAMLLLADWLTASLDIEDFGSALWGAVIVSIVSWAFSIFLPDRARGSS